jgi:pyruvate carboxylase
MRVAMEAVQETDAICEAAICYTGDIRNPKRSKYDLKYYVKMAKELENLGAHILAIKDMAGLCKPYAAAKLVETLRQEVGIPIHFHTHDTGGLQAAAILKGSDAGMDIADAALAPLSGGTSQPNMNTLVESLRSEERDTHLHADHLDALAEYWRAVRDFYTPFESPVLPAGADLYHHEMPGGQYTNLFHQAQALGLADRWAEVCQVYADVNQLLGDIVKVTPTSKAVGDMALYLIANDMQAADVLSGDKEHAYPQSVIDLLSGRMGQTPGGFPPDVVRKVVKDGDIYEGRPGETMPDADFDATLETIKPMLEHPPTRRDVLSYLLYPKVFEEFAVHCRSYGDTSVLATPTFFYGMESGDELSIDIETGKTLIVRFLAVGEPREDGRTTLFFELNGQPREVTVMDRSLEAVAAAHAKADPANPNHVGSGMPGMVVNVTVKAGDRVTKGQPLAVLEAMKMQTTITAPQDGTIVEVKIHPGTQVDVGDLILVME